MESFYIDMDKQLGTDIFLVGTFRVLEILEPKKKGLGINQVPFNVGILF